jgi:hypothetical protein
MFKQISISTKITGLVISIVLVTLLAISYISYKLSRDAVQERFSESLKVVGESQSRIIESHFDNVIANLKLIQESKTITDGIKASGSSSSDSNMDFGFGNDDPFAEENTGDDPFGSEESDSFGGGFGEFGEDSVEPAISAPVYDVQGFINELKKSYSYQNVIIVQPGGKIKYSTNPALTAGANFIDPDGNTLSNAVQGVYFSNIVSEKEKYSIYAGAPLNHTDGETSIVLIQMAMNKVYDIINDNTGLGEKGEIIIARLDSTSGRINYLNKPRNDPDGAFKILSLGDPKSKAIQRAVTGNSGAGANIDYRDFENLAYWTYIPNVKWGLVTKIDTDEIFANSNSRISNSFNGWTCFINFFKVFN